MKRLFVLLCVLTLALSACGGSAKAKKALAGPDAAVTDTKYVSDALHALGMGGISARPAFYTGNDYCGGPHDDQGEIVVSAYLGMLSPEEGDRVVTTARDFWKSQGFKIESFALRAPKSVDHSRTPPVPSKDHYSAVDVDAHGYELRLSWGDNPGPGTETNTYLSSTSPCATPLTSASTTSQKSG